MWFFLVSTQMITNSYDDEEPSQPMKAWNKGILNLKTNFIRIYLFRLK